jgi:hypothetical protein
MPSCPVTPAAPATKSSDAAKQMLAMIGQNVQKITESYNEMKKDQAKATVDAAAAQMLFDSVASEAARLKQDMQKSQSEAVASKAKCQSDTNSLLTATVLHKRASATAKDTKTIDQELAVIQQLRQKLQEVPFPFKFRAHLLQNSTRPVISLSFVLPLAAPRHQRCSNIEC